MIERLGIIDFRNIIKAVLEHYEIDFSDFAMTSFKRRLQNVINQYNLNTANNLIERIKQEPNFKPLFLKDISIDETEMFRDPSLWRELSFILQKNVGNRIYRVWFPDVSSGEELYSFLVLLKEIDLYDKVEVIATSISSLNLESIKKGVYELKKMEINQANYLRYNHTKEKKFYQFYEERRGKIYMDTNLLKNTKFLEYGAFQKISENAPSKIKLIVYRNKMIYFNKLLQIQTVEYLSKILLPGGHFVIGVKEASDCCNINNKFILVNKAENIYKKIL